MCKLFDARVAQKWPSMRRPGSFLLENCWREPTETTVSEHNIQQDLIFTDSDTQDYIHGSVKHINTHDLTRDKLFFFLPVAMITNTVFNIQNEFRVVFSIEDEYNIAENLL